METEKNEIFSENEIQSGKYRDCYLIYNRKSTDEPNNQKNSIDYQRAENTRYAKQQLLPIATVTIPGFSTNGVISEKHSGFKEDNNLLFSKEGMVQYSIDRPKFLKMAQYLRESYFKGVICLCWDRLSRNKGDDMVARKLIRNRVDVRFVYANYEPGSAGELHMDIDGMYAQHQSRVTSEKVILALRNSRALGKCTYRAPIGYLNNGNMDHKPRDPARAPIIKELFELYATGEWSLSDLARHSVSQGFTTIPMRRRRSKSEMLADDADDKRGPKISRPVTVSLISRILSNPFYTGRIRGEHGAYVPSSSHEAIVDDDLFQRVQTALKKSTVSIQYDEKLNLPMRGMIRCSFCKRVYTPYMQKGILYFYVRCQKGCKNSRKNCNLDYVTEKISHILSMLHFNKQELSELDSNLNNELSILEEKQKRKAATNERHRKQLEKELEYLKTNQLHLLTSGLYTPESILTEQSKLEKRRRDLESAEQSSLTDVRQVFDQAIRVSKLIESLVPLFRSSKPDEQERIARATVTELFISENTAEYNAQSDLSFFKNRNFALGYPTAWFLELLENKEKLELAEKSLKPLI